jgi:hypothetical protein
MNIAPPARIHGLALFQRAEEFTAEDCAGGTGGGNGKI